MIAELAQSAIVAAALATGVARSMTGSILNPFKIRMNALQKAQEKTNETVGILCTDVGDLKNNVKLLHEGQNTLTARAVVEARNIQKRFARTDADVRRIQTELAEAGITPPDAPPESGTYQKND